MHKNSIKSKKSRSTHTNTSDTIDYIHR